MNDYAQISHFKYVLAVLEEGGVRAAAEVLHTTNFALQGADENFASVFVSRHVSRLVLGHSFGAKPAPGGTASLCFCFASPQVLVPP
jgi:hypothetical protein